MTKHPRGCLSATASPRAAVVLAINALGQEAASMSIDVAEAGHHAAI